MNKKALFCLASTIVFATSTLAHAQSLTEAAKQERARRAKLLASSGGPAKLYTDGDRTGAALGTASGEAAAAPAPTGGEPTAPSPSTPKTKEKTPEQLAAERQAEWTEKVKKAEEEIKNLEGVIARNERSLASMYNPSPAKSDMIAAIDSDKKKLVALKQGLVTLEDERRRAGMPRLR